jgi:hypothetical protein
MKLKHVDEGYFKHLATAIGFAFMSMLASLAMLVHSVLPSVFEKTGSKILSRIIVRNATRANGSAQHIQIRYNTNSKNEILPWRIIINGKEYLAQNVIISGNVFGEKSYVDNVAKFNIATYGTVVWDKNTAIVIA